MRPPKPPGEGRRENDVLESISQPDIVLSKNFYKPKYVFCKLTMEVTFKISKQFPEEIGKKNILRCSVTGLIRKNQPIRMLNVST